MVVDHNIKYIRSNDISVSLDKDNAVLLDPDKNQYKTLNRTALFIWKRLNGKNTVEEISADILSDFNSVPKDDLERDIFNLIKDLEGKGFIRIAEDNEFLTDEEYPHVYDGPKSIDVSLTGKCNLHCDYCFYANEMHGRPDLPKDEWFRFFEELKGLAVKDLVLSGGEVFVRKDLFELIDNLIENRMRYSILSNGTLITEEIIEKLTEKKRRLRLDSIQVSIDGSCPEVHDKSRGVGSFDKAIRGLRLLKEAGLPVTSRVTINRYNVDDLENVVKLLLDDIGLYSIGTNDAVPMGAGCDNQSSITLTPDQQLKAILKMHELDLKYEGRITASAGPLAKWKMYGEMERAKATGEKPEGWQMGYLTACGCHYSKISIHHDGIISPCNMLPGLEMGRINRDPIKKIWKNHKILKELKDRRQIPMREVPGCEDCEWAEYCNGSCPGLPYTITGDFNRANTHDCYRKFLKESGLKSPDVPWFKP